MGFYFSDDKYRNIANSKGSCSNYSLTSSKAFSILIKDLDYKDLDVLFETYAGNYDVPGIELYKCVISGKANDEVLNGLLNCAIDLASNGKNMGSNESVRPNGARRNTSNWINHCLNVGVVCKNLGTSLNLDADKAFALGILHDVGRKKSQKFDHTIKGFEYLVDLSYEDEAFACLTHSFVNGGRCASNEKAEEGFYLDNEGNPHFMDDAVKDDITVFLENYEYNDYDLILNIADLVATSSNIATIEERLKDIATRREIDPTNRGYFLCELINLVNYFLNKLGYSENINIEKFYKYRGLTEIEDLVSEKSNQFDNLYKDILKKNEFSY